MSPEWVLGDGGRGGGEGEGSVGVSG